MRILLILAGLTLSLAAASQEIYRWVDKDGIVHYADQPGAPNAELVTVVAPNAYEGDAATRRQPASDDGAGRRTDSLGLRVALDRLSRRRTRCSSARTRSVSVGAELDGTLQTGSRDRVLRERQSAGRRDGLGLELDGLAARHAFPARERCSTRTAKPVISSQQITFHVRQASIQNPQTPRTGARRSRRARSRPPPAPTPLPSQPPGNLIAADRARRGSRDDA